MPLRTRCCCGLRRPMSSPSSRTVPSRSVIMPKIAFIAVDLPAPLGPTMTGDLALLGLDGAVADDVRAAVPAGHPRNR